MQRIGLIVNEAKPRAAEAVRELARLGARLGLSLYAHPDIAALAEAGAPLRACPTADFARHVQAVIALGGDGTLLRAAHSLQGSDLPLMGLNIGSLGYLTSVDDQHFAEALTCLRDDRFQLSRRATLASRVRRADGACEPLDLHALNDVVISRGASGRLAHIELALDGALVTTYVCDGLIVATATGSTAYSLSTGGPIVMPGTAALVISVICPHALGARPLVVPDTTQVTMRVAGAHAPLLLAVDGTDDITLNVGDGVEIRRSPCDAQVAFLPDHDAFAVLSRKLGWGGRVGA